LIFFISLYTSLHFISVSLDLATTYDEINIGYNRDLRKARKISSQLSNLWHKIFLCLLIYI
jgi:hypothetical protein